MRSPHEISGYPAADGIFCGPVYWLDEQAGHQPLRGSPVEELQAFQEAVGAAIEELRLLSRQSPEPAADLLAIQLAWLEDPELLLPVEYRIQKGEGAASALHSEITVHERAIDPAARADIRDIEQRLLKLLSKSVRPAPPKGAVLAGSDISPTQFLEADWSEGGAILLEQGSAASHAAILARGRGVPMIVGVGLIGRDHTSALVDGGSGKCVLDPATTQPSLEPMRSFKARNSRPLATANGEKIELLFNVNSLSEIAIVEPDCCDGIGLVRSEFLFGDTSAIPDEDAQAAAYSAIVEWAKGRPVTIRLLDMGGDKPTFGLATPVDRNSIESRGISVLLKNPGVLATQLRALLRASALGDVRILLPLVSKPEQIAAVREMLRDCASGTARPLPLGVMVELPTVASHPENFASADFFSLGTNDLTQFITGRSRQAVSAAKLSPSERRELFKLISNVISYGQAHKKAVSLCGDLASDLNSWDDLLKLGLRRFSVPPLRATEFAPLRRNR
jgi:phosphoenolpyruvate-protein phosphotransferase (PTS system enzyme I)